MIDKRLPLLNLRKVLEGVARDDRNAAHRFFTEAEVAFEHVFGRNSPEFERIAAAYSWMTTVPDIPSVWASADEVDHTDYWGEGHAQLLNYIDAFVLKLGFQMAPPAPPTVATSPTNDRRVFVVHGHDEGMKESVARVLTRLGLEPLILHEQPNKGRTIIEKFTDYSAVGFAVVLLSPDDVGRAHAATELQPRARQNVVFEMGFFLAKLGRDKVLALIPEGAPLERPSDYDGVLYVPFDPLGAWRLSLVRELAAVGYNVDANALYKSS